MVLLVSHSGRFTQWKLTHFPFSSRWGVLQSRSKRFRGELKLMPLLRIEPKFLGWMCIRTGIVYSTVAFRNIGNDINGGKMYLVFIFRITTEKYGFDTEYFRVLENQQVTLKFLELL
jgi:hypothetical protein